MVRLAIPTPFGPLQIDATAPGEPVPRRPVGEFVTLLREFAPTVLPVVLDHLRSKQDPLAGRDTRDTDEDMDDVPTPAGSPQEHAATYLQAKITALRCLMEDPASLCDDHPPLLVGTQHAVDIGAGLHRFLRTFGVPAQQAAEARMSVTSHLLHVVQWCSAREADEPWISALRSPEKAPPSIAWVSNTVNAGDCTLVVSIDPVNDNGLLVPGAAWNPTEAHRRFWGPSFTVDSPVLPVDGADPVDACRLILAARRGVAEVMRRSGVGDPDAIFRSANGPAEVNSTNGD